MQLKYYPNQTNHVKDFILEDENGKWQENQDADWHGRAGGGRGARGHRGAELGHPQLHPQVEPEQQDQEVLQPRPLILRREAGATFCNKMILSRKFLILSIYVPGGTQFAKVVIFQQFSNFLKKPIFPFIFVKYLPLVRGVWK